MNSCEERMFQSDICVFKKGVMLSVKKVCFRVTSVSWRKVLSNGEKKMRSENLTLRRNLM